MQILNSEENGRKNDLKKSRGLAFSASPTHPFPPIGADNNFLESDMRGAVIPRSRVGFRVARRFDWGKIGRSVITASMHTLSLL